VNFVDLGFLLISEFFTFFGFGQLRALGFQILGEILHLTASELHILGALVKTDQLRSHQARVVLIT
jgi:hypothetical protein